MFHRTRQPAHRLLGALLFVLVLCLAGHGANAQHFSDNFDAYANGSDICAAANWQTCAGTRSISNAQSVSAPNSAFLNRNGGVDATMLSRDFGPVSQLIVVEFKIRAINATAGTKGIIARSDSNTDAIQVRMSTTQRFQYFTGGVWTNLCGTATAANTWYTVRIVTNPSQPADTFDLSVTGGAYSCSATGIGYQNNVADIDKLYFYASGNNNADIYIDDVRVYNPAGLNLSAGAANPAASTIDNDAAEVAMLQVTVQETGGHENAQITQVTFNASGTGDDRSSASGGHISDSQVCLFRDTGTTPGAWDAADIADRKSVV